MKATHEMQIQKMEANYNEKLVHEYKRFSNYEKKIKELLKIWEVKYLDLKKEKEESETAIRADYNEIIKEKNIMFEEVSEYQYVFLNEIN